MPPSQTPHPSDVLRSEQQAHPGLPSLHQAQEFGRCEVLALLACAEESARPICVEDAPGRFLVFTVRELRHLLRMFDTQPGAYVSVADAGTEREAAMERRPGHKLAWLSDHPDRRPVWLGQPLTASAATWCDSTPVIEAAHV